MAATTSEQALRALQDRLDLQDLIIRYVQANDYAEDPDQLLQLFTHDAVLVGHFPNRDAHGLEQLRRYARDIIEMKKTTAYRHHVSNILCDVDGDRARMTAFFILVYRQSLYDEQVQLCRSYFGNYEFEALRVDGEWRISRRTVHLDPS